MKVEQIEAYRNRALSEYDRAISRQDDVEEIELRTGRSIRRIVASDIKFWRNEVDRLNNLMLVHK